LQSLTVALVLLSPTVAPTTVRARLGKPLGKNVQRPTAHKLSRTQRYSHLSARFDSRSCQEVDAASLDFNQPLVRNRAAWHVSRQVLHDISRIAARRGRRLDVNHPVASFHLAQQILYRLRVFDLQLSGLDRAVDTAEIMITEPPAEFLVVHQEWLRRFPWPGLSVSARHPMIPAQRWPTAGHQRVDMGMMPKSLVPSVQHHRRGCLHPALLADHLDQPESSAQKSQAERFSSTLRITGPGKLIVYL
jgi:hypothetical protein